MIRYMYFREIYATWKSTGVKGLAWHRLGVLLTLLVAYCASIPVGHAVSREYVLDNGQTRICLKRTEENACRYDQELAPCEDSGEVERCRNCTDGRRNCFRAYGDLDFLKCVRPEIVCKPEEVSSVLQLEDGGCNIVCVCNEMEGYRRHNDDCVKVASPCEINNTLINGVCTECPPGTYKPEVGIQACIPLPEPLPSIEPSVSRSDEMVTAKSSPVEQVNVMVMAKAISATVLLFVWKNTRTAENHTIVLTSGSTKRVYYEQSHEPVVNKTVSGLDPGTEYSVYIKSSFADGTIAKSKSITISTMVLSDDILKSGDAESGGIRPWHIAVIVICSLLLIIVPVGFCIMARKNKKLQQILANLWTRYSSQQNPTPQNPPPEDPPPPYTPPACSAREDPTYSTPADNTQPQPDVPPIVPSVSRSSTESLLSSQGGNGPDTTVPKVAAPEVTPSLSSKTERKTVYAGDPAEQEPLMSGMSETQSEFGPHAMKN